MNGLFSLSLPWAKVDVYLPAGKNLTFYTTMPVDIALCVGRDPAIPSFIYTSTAVGGLSTFIVAGELTMFLLMLSFMICVFSVGMSFLKYSSKGTLGFRSQLLCLIGTVFLNFLAVLSYMILTLYQLGRTGYYLNGFGCSAANAAIGVVCMIVSFLADAVTKQQIVLYPTSHQYGAVTELTQQEVAVTLSDVI